MCWVCVSVCMCVCVCVCVCVFKMFLCRCWGNDKHWGGWGNKLHVNSVTENKPLCIIYNGHCWILCQGTWTVLWVFCWYKKQSIGHSALKYSFKFFYKIKVFLNKEQFWSNTFPKDSSRSSRTEPGTDPFNWKGSLWSLLYSVVKTSRDSSNCCVAIFLCPCTVPNPGTQELTSLGGYFCISPTSRLLGQKLGKAKEVESTQLDWQWTAALLLMKLLGWNEEGPVNGETRK